MSNNMYVIFDNKIMKNQITVDPFNKDQISRLTEFLYKQRKLFILISCLRV
jgi:hypothetical protein